MATPAPKPDNPNMPRLYMFLMKNRKRKKHLSSHTKKVKKQP